ncbi:homeobox protein engrailed-1-like, partial [Amphibalanus amphitrite]|uniref:homeobox protein engrailed-1-like n=1 Tax=Amphibalanus amphitrite TaxID=1232801 RepID=UPI001C918E31
MSASEEQEGEPAGSPGSPAEPAATDSDSAAEPAARAADSPAGRKRSSFMIADVLRPSAADEPERVDSTGESSRDAEHDEASKEGGESAGEGPRPADTSLSILASIQRIVENHAKLLEARAPPPLDRRKASTAVRPAPDEPRPAAAAAAERPPRRRSASPPPPPPAHQQPLINSRLNFSIDNILRPDFSLAPGLAQLRAFQAAAAGHERSEPVDLRRGGGSPRAKSVSSPPAGAPGTPGTPAAPGADPSNNSRWPAWVYCTRYSDRPSS